MKVKEYFEIKNKPVGFMGLGTVVGGQISRYVIAYSNFNTIRLVNLGGDGSHFAQELKIKDGKDRLDFLKNDKELSQKQAEEMSGYLRDLKIVGRIHKDFSFEEFPPILISDYYNPPAQSFAPVCVGTILNVGGNKYVIAKVRDYELQLVNVHGGPLHCASILKHFDCRYLVDGEREFEEDEIKDWNNIVWEAEIIGCLNENLCRKTGDS